MRVFPFAFAERSTPIKIKNFSASTNKSRGHSWQKRRRSAFFSHRGQDLQRRAGKKIIWLQLLLNNESFFMLAVKNWWKWKKIHPVVYYLKQYLKIEKKINFEWYFQIIFKDGWNKLKANLAANEKTKFWTLILTDTFTIFLLWKWNW